MEVDSWKKEMLGDQLEKSMLYIHEIAQNLLEQRSSYWVYIDIINRAVKKILMPYSAFWRVKSEVMVKDSHQYF